MAAGQFNKYIWLVDTISSAGRISREEIDKRWARSVLNEKGESSLPERTFFRYKIAVEEMLGIEIKCDRAAGGLYYIADNGYESKNKQWILSQFAMQNSLNESRQLRGRILYEDIPQGTQYLTRITEAMSGNRWIKMKYQSFGSTESHELLIAAYCMKVFKQRWYVLGKIKNADTGVKETKRGTDVRLYALDRVVELQLTEQTFTLPKDFDAEQYFAGCYGVFRGKEFKPERIKVRVSEADAPFLRSLPLHKSQQESEPCVFTWYVAPTLDFIQQLRTFGSRLEVMAPESLREKFAEEVMKLANMY